MKTNYGSLPNPLEARNVPVSWPLVASEVGRRSQRAGGRRKTQGGAVPPASVRNSLGRVFPAQLTGKVSGTEVLIPGVSEETGTLTSVGSVPGN